MTGYVHTINRRRGLVAIQADAFFTIVQMLSSEPINLGDRLEWHDSRLGIAAYLNLTKGTKLSFNVQAHGVPADRVRQLLQL
jgi:hypothetical protein